MPRPRELCVELNGLRVESRFPRHGDEAHVLGDHEPA